MIRTKRLILRAFRMDDLADFIEFVRDKMSSPWAPYDVQWPTDEARLKGVLEWFCTETGWHAVELAETGKLIGYVMTNIENDGRECSIGYTIHRAYQRQGYAYEACRALMDEIGRDAKIECFTAGTGDCNLPSVGLLKKLGFVKVSSDEASFAKDDEGNPIVFAGGHYECRK